MDKQDECAALNRSESGDREHLARVLAAAVDCMQGKGIPYALIGGVASSHLGRPRTTRDIDIFVRPDDAQSAILALAEQGFRTEETDHKWIYKGFLEGVQVDVIFKTVGGTYLDQEMLDRAVVTDFEGRQVRVVPPEDLVLIKAIAYDEATPRHWFDALGVLVACRLDWDYLIERGRRAERRLLALLVYAQSVDIYVPKRVIRTLFKRAYPR